MTRRVGRRPGRTTTPDAILRAARAQFARRDYRAVTVRDVARDAGVDAALVHHFFGTKEAMFAAAILDTVRPDTLLPAVIGPGPDGLGERIVRAFLVLWDTPPTMEPLLAVLRSAVSHDEAAAALSELITERIMAPLAERLPSADRPLRAALVGTQLIGLVMERHVLRIEPLASLDHDSMVACVAPAIQRYLTGEIRPRVDG